MGENNKQAVVGTDAGAERLLDRFRARLRAECLRIPDSEYLEYLKKAGSPDLASTILIEIPAYQDPELLPTVKAALAMAANPDRLHFAICLQDDDPEKLEALYAIPNCRVKYYPSDEAPGLCAARYECQQMLDGEDFVFHIDSHMRFARFWDVAMIDQWLMCHDGKAVLSDHGCVIRDGWLSLPVDDRTFTQNVEMHCGVMNASFFTNNMVELRLRVYKLYRSDRPLPGAFISGHCMFGRPLIDLAVPNDPKMDFVADEHAIAARLWTNGFNLYHTSVRCIYHLYNRIMRTDTVYRTSSPVKHVEPGVSRKERQSRRLEKLFGVYDWPGVDLSGFDLGRERSLAEYQAFCGVDFRDLTIREFAAHGRFDQAHGEKDLAFFDWLGDFEKNNYKMIDSGTKLDVGIRPDAAEGFLKMCEALHLRPQAALTEAVRQWTDRRLRCRFC